MKEFSSRGERSGYRPLVDIQPSLEPPTGRQDLTRPSLDQPGGSPRPWSKPEGSQPGRIRTRRENATGLPESFFRPDAPGETVKHDAEVAREKFIDATGDYLATIFGDPFFFAATKSWYTESDPATEAIDATEAISGWLQGAVDTPLKSIGTALELSSGEAAFAAGVSTNLILAPIMGPPDKAETYIGVGGIIFGLLTGGHGLVVACIKPLLHQQLHHALAHAVVEAFGGSRTDRPRSDMPTAAGHNPRLPSDIPRPAPPKPVIHPMQPMPRYPERPYIPGPVRLPVPQETPGTRRQPAPREPLWLCIAFVPKPSHRSAAARTAPTRTAAKRAATKPVVLDLGDDAFLRSLPGALEGTKVSEVDVATAQSLRDPSRGQHFVIKLPGVSFGLGTVHATPSSQAAYQHPDCRTGRCVSADGPRCLCPCDVCRPARSPK